MTFEHYKLFWLEQIFLIVSALLVQRVGVSALKTLLFYLHERGWDAVRFGKKQVQPAVIWFTGLSGSGKSTIATHLQAQLQKRGWKCEVLDGDVIRSIFPSTGFSRAERDSHVRRVGHLASRLESHGIFVIASLISPYEESRSFVRGLCKNFIEVYISTPLSECERRDVKGLYARARRGERQWRPGLDAEVPVARRGRAPGADVPRLHRDPRHALFHQGARRAPQPRGGRGQEAARGRASPDLR